jgi:tellurite resistance protein
MVLVSAADGKVKEDENEVLVENLAADPLFQNVSPELAQAYVSDAVAALATEGMPQRLNVLTHGLSTHAQRLKAFRLAMRVANASGEASTSELKILDLLQATFGIADDEVERIRDQP